MHTYDLVKLDCFKYFRYNRSITNFKRIILKFYRWFTLSNISTVHCTLDISKKITEFNKYIVSCGDYSKTCSTNKY